MASAQCLLAITVSAKPVTFQVNSEDPFASVPPEAEREAHPDALAAWVEEVKAGADKAAAEGSWARAVEFYRALSFGMPDTAFAYRRLCEIHELKLGQPDKAEHYCWALIKRQDATLADRYHFVDLALSRLASEPHASVNVHRAKMLAAVVGDLRTAAAQTPNAVSPEQTSFGVATESYLPLAQEAELLACRLAVALKDATSLTTCIDKGLAAGADVKVFLPFRWVRSRLTGDSADQQRSELEAQALGLAPEDLAKAAGGAPTQSTPAVATTLTVSNSQVQKVGSGVTTRESLGAHDPRPTLWGTEERIAAGATLLGLFAMAWLGISRSKRADSKKPPQPAE